MNEEPKPTNTVTITLTAFEYHLILSAQQKAMQVHGEIGNEAQRAFEILATALHSIPVKMTLK